MRVQRQPKSDSVATGAEATLRGPRRRPGRCLASAISAVAIMAGATIAPHPASAARSWSDTIATQARTTLDALRKWQATDAADDELAYELLRDRLATTIAGAVETDAAVLRTEWDEADPINQEVILIATTQVGVPYRYLRSEEGVGFDCSGLLLFAFDRVGVELPRVSTDQIRAGEQIEAEEAEPGDLAQYPGHIMMVLGSGVILQARSTGYFVEVAHMPTRSLRYADVTPEGAVSISAGPSARPTLQALVGVARR